MGDADACGDDMKDEENNANDIEVAEYKSSKTKFGR